MQQYRIIIAEEGASSSPGLSFEAEGLREALAKVADHHECKPVELWCDGKFLGRLELIEDDGASFWQLG